ncbi:hypothetical protein QYF36_026210 [Acer negundo]|nr:hypothetical protein QYF36_026210 [Acer negundo]
MEFASNVLGSILSRAGEYLVVPIAHEIGYIFCFKSIVEEFQKQDTNLRLAQEHVQRQVDTATRNTEEIETDVQNWLTDVSNVVADVRRLEDEIKANELRLNGCCTHWGCRYKSSRRVAKKTSIMLKLRDDAGKFNNISHPTALPGIEFFKPKDFMTFESTKFAFDGMIEALKDDERSIIGLYGDGKSRSLREWPKLDGLEPCTAISLIDNIIQVLPNGLICPKLEILLLGVGYNCPTKMKVSDGFFKEMKALKVASLASGSLSLNSLQFLTNLVSLQFR